MKTQSFKSENCGAAQKGLPATLLEESPTVQGFPAPAIQDDPHPAIETN